MAKIKIQKRTIRGVEKHVVDLRYVKKDGGRHFFATRIEAEKFADKAKEEIQEGEGLLLNTQQKRDYLHAKDLLNGVGFIEAALFYRKHHKPLEVVSISDAMAKCVAGKRAAGKAKEYLRIFEHRIESLAEFLKRKANVVNISDVSHGHIEGWLHERGWSQATKHGSLIDVGTLFNYAIKQGWCASNPAKLVEAVDVGEYDKGILTPEQVAVYVRVNAELDPGLLRYTVDQLFGGMREDESRHMQASFVKDGHIELLNTKTGVIRFIDFNPTWLKWRKLHKKPEYAPIKNCNLRIDKLRKAIKVRLVEMNLAPKDFWFPRNCLRHSFCTYAAKVWGSGRAADLAGHSEAMQKKHYRRPVTLEAAKSFWQIHP